MSQRQVDDVDIPRLPRCQLTVMSSEVEIDLRGPCLSFDDSQASTPAFTGIAAPSSFPIVGSVHILFADWRESCRDIILKHA